ncbi:MAG: hypothetical protein Q9166_001329 [cf. Caloplaca sp. 2 TL-2023]
MLLKLLLLLLTTITTPLVSAGYVSLWVSNPVGDEPQSVMKASWQSNECMGPVSGKPPYHMEAHDFIPAQMTLYRDAGCWDQYINSCTDCVKLAVVWNVTDEMPTDHHHERVFWLDRSFNTALFSLDRQINRQFSDLLWNILGVEWKSDCFELDPAHVARFTSMKRLQRCTLILEIANLWLSYDYQGTGAAAARDLTNHSSRNLLTKAMHVELSIFGLAHKLNRMPHLREIRLECNQCEVSLQQDYFLRYQDGSLVRYPGDELKTVFSKRPQGPKECTPERHSLL